VFARYLNLTAGYVSQLKRGVKRPTGPTLVLLNIIQRKGIGAIL
jgi:putative transcriptional regulator